MPNAHLGKLTHNLEKKINAVTGGDIARPLSLLILKLTEGKDDPDKLEQSICNLLHRIPKLTIRANQ